MNAPKAVRDQQLQNPGLIDELVHQLRALDDVVLANPVFIDEEQALRSVTLEGLIVKLKPEVNPLVYFGVEWGNVELVGVTNVFQIHRKGASTTEILQEVQNRSQHQEVLWAEPNFLTEAIALWQAPDDPMWVNQWGINNSSVIFGAGVTARTAWDRTRGANTTIAIFDLGTQLNHPDLAGNMQLEDTPSNGFDDDGNGYVDDSYGWDFHTLLNPPPPPTQPDGDNDPGPTMTDDNHGTLCAGVATATTFNNQGLAGTAPDANLLILRIAESNPQPDNPNKWSIDAARVAKGIRYSAGQRFPAGTGNQALADVLSMSFSTVECSAINDALDFAATSGRNGKGCVIMAAAGNSASGWKWQSYKLPANAPAGDYTFRWEYSKNGSIFSGDDAVWLDQVIIPEFGTEGFEVATWPTEWVRSGHANWALVENGVNGNHAITGVLGEAATLRAIRSGPITDSQQTSVQITRYISSPADKYVSFYAWASSEKTNDVLKLHITGPNGFTPETHTVASGVPTIATTVGYPARHQKVIAVGGNSPTNFRVDYSQFNASPGGKTVDFLAPTHLGGFAGIATTDRTGSDGYGSGDYAYGSGTSVSCPLAAGVAALLLSYKPDLTAEQVRTHLRENCRKIGAVPYDGSGRNAEYGSGRLDAHRSVAQGAIDLDFSGIGIGPNLPVYAIQAKNGGARGPSYLLVGGDFTSFDGQSRPYLVNLNYNTGQLIPSFSPSISSEVLAIAIQSDSKILVGTLYSPYLVRLNSDGTTDTAFTPSLNGCVQAIVPLSDGKILIGGAFSSMIKKLNSDGTMDYSGYWLYTAFDNAVNTLVLRPDGKIMAGGHFSSVYSWPSWHTRRRLARLNSNGSLDTSFVDVSLNNSVESIAVLSDDSVVVGGSFTTYPLYSGPIRVARFDSSGNLLWSASTTPGADSTVYSIIKDSEDDFVIGGSFTSVNGEAANRMARLKPDGTVDPYFDVGSGPNSSVFSMTYQGSQVLAGGAFSTFDGSSHSGIVRVHGKNE